LFGVGFWRSCRWGEQSAVVIEVVSIGGTVTDK
jgi:hypothetical protein